MNQNPRLLRVDDDDDFRHIFAEALEQEGFEVTEIGDGAEAIRLARESTFDIAILDLQMPGIGGMELLKIFRAELPSTDCVMVTGHQELPLAIEAVRLGAKEFLSKPLNIGELVIRIKTIIRAHVAETRSKNLQAEFTSKLLHDLLTPLHSLKSAIEFLEHDISSKISDHHKKVFQGIESTISTMDALLNDMIDLSLFESGRVNIEKLPVNLDDLVPAITTRFMPRANAKHIELIVLVDDTTPTVALDPNKIEQVMQNLLDNAIKFTPGGGTIKIQVSPIEKLASGQKREFVEVRVSDTGAGISADELTYIFDKYKNLMAEKNSQQKTTGLGLTICKSIVEAHGGKMFVESIPGKGSSFSFLLPTD